MNINPQEIDWSKSTRELCEITGLKSNEVLALRKVYAPGLPYRGRGLPRWLEFDGFDKLDWNRPNGVIGLEIGLPPVRVCALRRRYAPKTIGMFWTARTNALNPDWSRPDTDIARDAGISRERVRQIRLRRDIPKSVRGGTQKRLNQIERAKGWDWTLTNSKLHYIHGVSEGLIRKIRHILNQPKASQRDMTLPYYSWDWTKRNKDLAVEHGKSAAFVGAARAVYANGVKSTFQYRPRKEKPAIA